LKIQIALLIANTLIMDVLDNQNWKYGFATWCFLDQDD